MRTGLPIGSKKASGTGGNGYADDWETWEKSGGGGGYGFFDAGSADAVTKHRRKRSSAAARPTNVGRKLIHSEYN